MSLFKISDEPKRKLTLVIQAITRTDQFVKGKGFLEVGTDLWPHSIRG